MKKLELKGLWNLQALQDVLEASVTNDELQRPRHLLFSEKIKFPSLKEMHLEDLNEIENLCDFSGSIERDVELSHLQSQTWRKQPYGRSPCFGNLKCMTVSYCNKLKSLFPSSIVCSLLQLETLQVNGCDNMEEVITSTEVEDESNPTTKISFPKLHTLELRLLNSLQCFYKGHLLIKFPKLRELNLDNLKKLKGFTLPNTQSLQTQGTILFDGEIDFPSLEHIGLSWMKIESLQRHGETTIFPNLSRLALKGLPNLKSLPNINPKTLRFLDLNKIECFKVLFSIRREYMCFMSPILSWELEELTLEESGSLEELVDVENSIGSRNQFDVKLLVSLKKLDLCRLHNLKRIPWNMLRNLRSLIIYTLKGWTSLISTTLLVGGAVLPLLEHIEVVMCDSLEAIISQEPQEDEDLVKYGMTLLPCLRHIELYWLPKLEIFSKGSYEAHFPSLETVVIWDCHYLQLFSMGPLRTPRLKYVKLDSKTTEADTFLDLNALVAAAAEENKIRRVAEAQAKREAAEEAEARLAAEAKVKRSTKAARSIKWQRAFKAKGLEAEEVDPWGVFDLEELETADEDKLRSLWGIEDEDELWGPEALAFIS